MNYLPTREQWMAVSFLTLLVYSEAAGSGESYRVWSHLWFGYGVTYALVGLSAWTVGEMLYDWIKPLLRAALARATR